MVASSGSRISVVLAFFLLITSGFSAAALGQRVRVAKDWCRAMSSVVNTACVYPPREDVLVGDVIAYTKNPEKRRWVKGLQPVRLERLGKHLPAVQPAGVPLPKFSGRVETANELDVLAPGVGGLGIDVSSVRSVEVALDEVSLMEVDFNDVMKLRSRIAELEDLPGFNEERNRTYLRVLSGVYTAKELDIVVEYERTIGVALSARLDEAKCAGEEQSRTTQESAGAGADGSGEAATRLEGGRADAGSSRRPEEAQAPRVGAEGAGPGAVRAAEDVAEPTATVCVSRVSGATVELRVERKSPVAVAVKGWRLVYYRNQGSLVSRGSIGGQNPVRRRSIATTN